VTLILAAVVSGCVSGAARCKTRLPARPIPRQSAPVAEVTRMFATVRFGLALLLAVSGAQSAPAPRKQTLGTFLLRMNDAVQRDLVEAAELMPAEHYGFTATNQTRPFGHTVAHVALSRFGSCSGLLGRDNPRQGEREDAPRTKAEVVALLKEAGALCSEAQKGLTDDSLLEFISIPGAKVAVQKGVFLAGEIAHGYEVYGTMAVHLRLKGLVPPTTARKAMKRPAVMP
jgi:hypothetical protein